MVVVANLEIVAGGWLAALREEKVRRLFRLELPAKRPANNIRFKPQTMRFIPADGG